MCETLPTSAMNPTSASRIRKIWGPVRSVAGSGIAERVCVLAAHP
jgi:hypothetical protein